MADGREVNSVVLSEANQWQHTFAKLDKYDNGVEIKYTITKDEIKNYKTDITGNTTESYTIKNMNIEKLAIPEHYRETSSLFKRLDFSSNLCVLSYN